MDNKNSNINPSKDQLLQYLQGEMSEVDKHEFEKEMSDSDLLNDAVEGLQDFNSTDKLNNYVSDLNKQLKKYTASKKKRRFDYKLQFNFWGIISIILIITLIIIAFFILKKI